MTLSIWRYSHFVLAFITSLFLVVASITGMILAIEPVSHQAKGYAVNDLNEVSLAAAISNLKANYDEVFELQVESSGFVKASVLTDQMEALDIYIDANTGEQIGLVEDRPYLYSFATNLHRSLFLKSFGRFIVGIVSLLLLFITVTGILLLAQRQGGFKRLLSRVQNEYVELQYHVILSRWFFIPIVILSISGVYLSAAKFELLPENALTYENVEESKTLTKYESIELIPFFKETPLSEVRQVEFPFSSDPQEFYQIALQDREIQVNQQTGEIISSAKYPFTVIASQLSWTLHTGEGNVLWSILLLLTSAAILFFIYSGFVMSFKRLKKVSLTTQIPDKNDCEFVILVGSETGSTYDFATRLFNGLTASGKKVYLTQMNKYSAFAKAEHIIILTATYGDGEPPTNARKFTELLPTIQQPNVINYTVIGFGSTEYPAYCKFAIEVNELLKTQPEFNQALPLHKINNRESSQFQSWVKDYRSIIETDFIVDTPRPLKVKKKKIDFKVVNRTELNCDDTFLITLKARKNVNFASGDLLAVLPPTSDIARQYSIARIDNYILLSIKKHEYGKASTYLYSLNAGDSIKASIISNAHFHLPSSSNDVILIGNGTGIAPFLGMIQKDKKRNIYLFWGGRIKESAQIYEDYLSRASVQNPNLSIHKCFSREQPKLYVQDLLFEQASTIKNLLECGGTIMICGSLAMQNEVLDRLDQIFKGCTYGVEELRSNSQLKTDCY